MYVYGAATKCSDVSQKSFPVSAVKEKSLAVESAGSVCSTPPRLHNSILQPTFSYTDMHYNTLQVSNIAFSFVQGYIHINGDKK